MTPSRSPRRSRSFAARGRYGHTWAEESRSHIAAISPVSTAVSGLASKVPGCTVVSSVLGKQFVKIARSTGSRMTRAVEAIYASTAALRNLRSAGRGRFDAIEESTSENIGRAASDDAPAPTTSLPARMTKDLLVRFGLSIILSVILPAKPAFSKTFDREWNRFPGDAFQRPAERSVATTG